MSRALVLGGGGAVGIGWEMGVLAGLAEGGVDAREADLIVGTSAGAVVGTWTAHGRDPRELLAEYRTRELREANGFEAPDAVAVFMLWASFEEITEDAAKKIGAEAMKARTMPEAQWLSGFEANAWDGWPQRELLITAVACETGRFRAFDRKSGVPIAKAVAASCTVPGLVPPVLIDGAHYIDGGVGSATSADLALRVEPKHVIIVAPLGWNDRPINVMWGRHIAREVKMLEDAGVRVTLIQPDESARECMANMMDQAQAIPAAIAGEAHGRALSETLRSAWS